MFPCLQVNAERQLERIWFLQLALCFSLNYRVLRNFRASLSERKNAARGKKFVVPFFNWLENARRTTGLFNPSPRAIISRIVQHAEYSIFDGRINFQLRQSTDVL